MKSTKSQLKMHYGACPKKLEARYQTIIKTYRDYYKQDSIPKDKQYWSICGRCSYKFNQIEPNCEPDQLVKYNLIKPKQFYGVEISPEIFEYNKKSNKKMHWFNGDFYEQMIEYSNNNKFNPAIVNVDMLLMPKCGVEYLSKVMSFLSTKTDKVMVIANFILRAWFHKCDINEITKGLEKEPMFQCAMNNGKWKIHKKVYVYNGTGKTNTKMGSVIFFKV